MFSSFTPPHILVLCLFAIAACGDPAVGNPIEPPPIDEPTDPPPCSDNSDVRFEEHQLVLTPDTDYDLSLTINVEQRSQCGLSISSQGELASVGLDSDGDSRSGKGEVDLTTGGVGQSTIALHYRGEVIDTASITVHEPTGAIIIPSAQHLRTPTQESPAFLTHQRIFARARLIGPSGIFTDSASIFEGNGSPYWIETVTSTENVRTEEGGIFGFTALEIAQPGEHFVDVALFNGTVFRAPVIGVDALDVARFEIRWVQPNPSDPFDVEAVALTAEDVVVVGPTPEITVNGEPLESYKVSSGTDDPFTPGIDYEFTMRWNDTSTTQVTGPPGDGTITP